MALRALAICALIACKGNGDAGKPVDLAKRCEQLAKTCGDNDKHVAKIVEECTQAAKTQAEKGCTGKAVAAYDCYEKELCGKGDNVWTMDDLRVLTERHSKCVAERNASSECSDK
jgi:hypothetical protein